MKHEPTQSIIGEAPAFLEMLEHVSRAAPLDKPVLVVGERGTGKELIASRLHYLSERWEHRVVKVNCAALTESILEMLRAVWKTHRRQRWLFPSRRLVTHMPEPMIKASWTKCFIAGGGSVGGWGGMVVAGRLAGAIGWLV